MRSATAVGTASPAREMKIALASTTAAAIAACLRLTLASGAGDRGSSPTGTSSTSVASGRPPSPGSRPSRPSRPSDGSTTHERRRALSGAAPHLTSTTAMRGSVTSLRRRGALGVVASDRRRRRDPKRWYRPRCRRRHVAGADRPRPLAEPSDVRQERRPDPVSPPVRTGSTSRRTASLGDPRRRLLPG